MLKDLTNSLTAKLKFARLILKNGVIFHAAPLNVVPTLI